MSQVDEQLSAFLDGELPHEQLDLLLARLDREPAHRARLARYALIGECVRGVPASVPALGVAEKVRAALLDEQLPTVIARRAVPGWAGWATGGLAAAAVVLALMATGPAVLSPVVAPRAAAIAPPPQIDDALSTITVAERRRLGPRAAARLTGYLMAHGGYANQLSRSTLDSHLVAARAERASWRQVQDPGDVR